MSVFKKIDINSILAPIFLGSGIGLLVTPAFVWHMIGWNMFGFLVIVPGLYFCNKALSK